MSDRSARSYLPRLGIHGMTLNCQAEVSRTTAAAAAVASVGCWTRTSWPSFYGFHRGGAYSWCQSVLETGLGTLTTCLHEEPPRSNSLGRAPPPGRDGLRNPQRITRKPRSRPCHRGALPPGPSLRFGPASCRRCTTSARGTWAFHPATRCPDLVCHVAVHRKAFRTVPACCWCMKEGTHECHLKRCRPIQRWVWLRALHGRGETGNGGIKEYERPNSGSGAQWQRLNDRQGASASGGPQDRRLKQLWVSTFTMCACAGHVGC